MKTTAFTICANNYLAHAKTLAVSFKSFHPEVDFVIAILDKPHPSIDYKALGADSVVWVHEIFPEMVNALQHTYSIAELCTVVKPQLFKHFYDLGSESVLYIDPDIKVFSRFDEILSSLTQNEVILTPHICSPTGEEGHPLDKDLMRTGIYNLGFLAMKKSEATIAFVEWWDKRVQAYGYHDLKKGYFFDQIWLGFAPAFIDAVHIERHPGYNMANWNLHERTLISNNNGYAVNTTEIPLRFFHFSHFKMEQMPVIASYNENFDLNNRPDIVPVFQEYKSNLLANNYEALKEIPYHFGKKPEAPKPKTLKKKIQHSRPYRSLRYIKRALKVLIYG
jgi:hypothetical protein